jgi:hypothetical protein
MFDTSVECFCFKFVNASGLESKASPKAHAPPFGAHDPEASDLD